MNVFIILLTILILIIIMIIVESHIELNSLRVTEYVLSENVPKSLKGKKMVFISDYHEAVNGKLNQRILDEVKQISPDLILIGGDMVNSNEIPEDCKPAIELLNGLSKIGKCLYSLGNHEKKMSVDFYNMGVDFSGYLKQLNDDITFLCNDKYYINGKDAKDGVIYGLDIPLEYYGRISFPKLEKEKINELLSGSPEGYSILLGHAPDFIDGYSDWGADLALSGHFHGGIIRFPFLGGLISPRFMLFPRYDYGKYKKGKTIMIVTNGMGQHSLCLRVNNIPEIVSIKFQ